MILVDQHVDSLAGLTHFKYQQTFMDIPIEGAGCIEHYDTNGSLLFINAKVADSIKKNHKPGIGPEEAITILIENLQKDEGIKFAWNEPDWEEQIKLDYSDSNATWHPTAELVWAIDELKDVHLINSGSRYFLAYKTSITLISPSFETFIYYVDAVNGSVLKFNSTRINDGPADVYGYGSRTIDTRWEGGFTQGHVLFTDNNTRNIHTKECDDCTWWTASETKDGDDNWGSTYLTETSTHFHTSTSWDYYRTVFGRTGQNNQSREIRVKTQLNEPNAYFVPNGGSHNELVFGKSSGWDYGMEPSIVAHEFAHGVTHHSSNLAYLNESGAINESFSDIFGVVIQAVMLDGGATDWILGNFIPNTPTRSLNDPNSKGLHWLGTYDLGGYPEYGIGQPDTYGGTYWCSNCPGGVDIGGVHINSGVQNHWFYILSNGKNSVNDLGDLYNINGIGMTKAARIAYYAQTSLLLNSSQYSDSRQATITAAKILFGECSVEHQATIDSWYAVGLGDLNDCTYTVSVSELNENNLLVYPNPTEISLNIELPDLLISPLKIYDVAGRLVLEKESNSLAFSIDLNNLDQGTYSILFEFDGGIINKRFIIQ